MASSVPVIPLRRVTMEQILSTQYGEAVDEDTLSKTQAIVDRVKNGGEAALRAVAVQFGDIKHESDTLILYPADLKRAYDNLPVEQQQLLQRTSKRIYDFAVAQRRSLVDMTMPVPGGEAGHTVVPVRTGGCYAPGGRFPLPSSVMMTACTARAAGVTTVIVASPRPAEITKAAAHVAGADMLLTVGGAQAITALAYGISPLPCCCDVIVGPGNRWVTAAKKIVSGMVGIDMIAGPSELLVIADDTSDAVTVAADLLAQSEHDTDARPILVTTSEALVTRVEQELHRQLTATTFPAANQITATAACSKGFAVVCNSINDCITVSNRIAPEHLEVLCDNSTAVGQQLAATGTYGGLFIGSNSAEVLGDYGCGPNHTLPTMATARYTGGLSVLNFLRVRTWLRVDAIATAAAQQMVADSVMLARLEGLEGHARSAERRLLPAAAVAAAAAAAAATTTTTTAVTTMKAKAKRSAYIRSDFDSLLQYSPVNPLSVLAAALGLKESQFSKLNANENLYGCVPAAAAAIAELMAAGGLHVYPDPDQNALRAAVAAAFTPTAAFAHSVSRSFTAANVVAGAGSDELLDLLFTLSNSSTCVTSTPTFSMYQFFAELRNCDVVDVSRGNSSSDWALDVDRMIAACSGPTTLTVAATATTAATTRVVAAASLVFIASPNNPTGDVLPFDQLRRLCAATADKAIIVLDEAYCEFITGNNNISSSSNSSSSSAIDLVHDYSNLVVLRTFSKWSGLAGLRIGIMLASPEIINAVLQVKQPYNVSVVADAAAVVSLQHKDVVLSTAVQAMLFERERLMVVLQLLYGTWFTALPSEANFVLFVLSPESIAVLSARQLQQQLQQRGVLVRCYAGNKDNNNSLNSNVRVSCGRPEDTEKLLVALWDIQEKFFASTAAAATTTTAATRQQRQQQQQEQLLTSIVAKNNRAATPAAILFDLDGVLIDVSTSYRVAIVAVVLFFLNSSSSSEHTAASVSEGVERMKREGNSNNDWLLSHRLLQRLQPTTTVSFEAVKAKFQELYLGLPATATTAAVAGLRDSERLLISTQLLQQLAATTTLAVVTGRPRAEALHFLQQHNIQQLFAAVVTMDDVRATEAKPHALPTLLALQRLQLISSSNVVVDSSSNSQQQQYVLFIGDTVDDINSSNNANRVLQSNSSNFFTAAAGADVQRSKLVVVPLGIPAPRAAAAATTSTAVVTAAVIFERQQQLLLAQQKLMADVNNLFRAGASRVLVNLGALRELVLHGNTSNNSDSKSSYSIYDIEHNNNLADNIHNTLATTTAAATTRAAASRALSRPHRTASVTHKTSETHIVIMIDLDGTGVSSSSTGIGFLDHMITALSKHSRIDIAVAVVSSDLHVDDHHTTEDTGIALGKALAAAVGDKRGIRRYGSAHAPLDEALALAVVDFSGRASAHVDMKFTRESVGTVSTEMLTHFLESFGTAAAMTLHVEVIKGKNDHHKCECSFKALALALRVAVAIDEQNSTDIPSTKDAL